MKSKIIAITLFASTVATVAFYPMYQTVGAITPIQPPPVDSSVVKHLTSNQPRIEVVFALDTTGSMSGLIQAAKEKIWSIASTMASAQQTPEISIGLVAYRDRGDAYVTKVVDLSGDLDSMYATLMDFQAGGGGDGPESVNQALDDAINKISWSENDQTYKVVFLVGDAPPHMDYQDDVKYPKTLATAKAKGIIVNAIQCGQNNVTTQGWQQIAQLGSGRYFQVEQAGNAVAISTPFDRKIATLSKKLDDTRLYYGNEEEKKSQQNKLKATDKLHAKSSDESLARRATFNASVSGKKNFLGENELVEDIVSGRVELSSIESNKLPESMKAMAPKEQEALIKEKAERRNDLQRQIKVLAQSRSSYLNKKVDEIGGVKDSLDDKVYSAIREQAEAKGLRYEADAPAY